MAPGVGGVCLCGGLNPLAQPPSSLAIVVGKTYKDRTGSWLVGKEAIKTNYPTPKYHPPASAQLLWILDQVRGGGRGQNLPVSNTNTLLGTRLLGSVSTTSQCSSRIPLSSEPFTLLGRNGPRSILRRMLRSNSRSTLPFALPSVIARLSLFASHASSRQSKSSCCRTLLCLFHTR